VIAEKLDAGGRLAGVTGQGVLDPDAREAAREEFVEEHGADTGRLFMMNAAQPEEVTTVPPSVVFFIGGVFVLFLVAGWYLVHQ